MSELYNRIAMLCKQQGISIGKMCNQLGISRGNLTELKMERIKTLKTDNLTKIAVFLMYLWTTCLVTKKSPPQLTSWTSL